MLTDSRNEHSIRALFPASVQFSNNRGESSCKEQPANCRSFIFSFGYHPGVSNRRHRSRLASRLAVVLTEASRGGEARARRRGEQAPRCARIWASNMPAGSAALALWAGWRGKGATIQAQDGLGCRRGCGGDPEGSAPTAETRSVAAKKFYLV